MIIGTAGHSDHGKTALVKALTGMDADRLAEEKARGISIDLGFAYADLGQSEGTGDDLSLPAGAGGSGRITGFVDVPGHERLVRTMLAGAGGIDFALLVVAADEGVMAQTREHLAILSMLGLTRGLVALTKADLADAERRAAVTAQIAEVLAGTAFEGGPIIPVSTVTGEGVDTLRAHLARAEAETPARDATGPFRLAIDRSFALAGAGTVVTGRVLSGRVRIGDQLVISPQGLAVQVCGIHAQNRKVAEARAGQRCALNLTGEGVVKEAIRRGDIALAPHLHAPSERIDALLTIAPGERKAVGTWFPVHLHSHAGEVPARVVPLMGDLHPGTAGPVQLVLERPIAAVVGDRFVLRDTSASRSLGAGQFIDLRAPLRKRSVPERLAWLDAAREADPAQALLRLLRVAPVEMTVFLRDRGLDPAAGPELVKAAGGVLADTLALSRAHLGLLRTKGAALLETFHEENPDLPGMGREKLRLALSSRLPKEAFLTLVRVEAAAGRLVIDGALLRLPAHTVQLSPADEALFARILPGLLGEVRFRPPRVRDIARDLAVNEREIRRVLKLTQKMGLTDQFAPDHFFAREVTREMVAILTEIGAASPDGWFSAAAFRDRLQNGRKVAIEILEFLDRMGLTLRRGDLRRINPHQKDLFGH